MKFVDSPVSRWQCLGMAETTMTPGQVRAARGLLGMTQAGLADAAGVGISTVADLELERRAVSAEKVAAIRVALEAAGVAFIGADAGGGLGVRLAGRRKQRRGKV